MQTIRTALGSPAFPPFDPRGACDRPFDLPSVRLPNEYAAELRSTSDPATRGRLANELARSTRTLVVRSIRVICARHGAEQDAEDGAQELVPKLVDRMVRGEEPPRPGEEVPYIRESAKNKARDILRGKGIHKHRRYEPLTQGDEPRVDPLTTVESETEQAEMIELMRDLLGELNETHREVIEAHRFRRVPLIAIAQQWFSQGRASSLQKAKQNVQATHSRALKVLRELAQKRRAETEAKA